MQADAEAEAAGSAAVTPTAVGVALLFVLVEIPVAVCALCFLAGCVLAAAESWGVGTGMLYVLTNVLGMPLGLLATGRTAHGTRKLNHAQPFG